MKYVIVITGLLSFLIGQLVSRVMIKQYKEEIVSPLPFPTSIPSVEERLNKYVRECNEKGGAVAQIGNGVTNKQYLVCNIPKEILQ